MTHSEKRDAFAAKRKMQEAAKKRAAATREFGPQFRDTPAGRRMRELRKRKLGEE